MANSQLPAVLQQMGNVPALARQNAHLNNELAGGIMGGFGVFSFRGKTWSIKFKGEQHYLRRPDDGTPVAAIKVVIVKAPDHLSKVWYEAGWQDGSNAPPDCYSTNGVIPNADSPKLQNPTCASCRWNQFGSKMGQDGKAGKGKACADTKRLAVIPSNDLSKPMEAATFGGPLLLRVPADSLRALTGLTQIVSQAGVNYFACEVMIGFDHTKSHPALTITPTRWLTDDEYAAVERWRDHENTQRILDEAVENEGPVTEEGNVLGVQGSPPAGASTLRQQAHAAAQARAPQQAPVQQAQPMTVAAAADAVAGVLGGDDYAGADADAGTVSDGTGADGKPKRRRRTKAEMEADAAAAAAAQAAAPATPAAPAAGVAAVSAMSAAPIEDAQFTDAGDDEGGGTAAVPGFDDFLDGLL